MTTVLLTPVSPNNDVASTPNRKPPITRKHIPAIIWRLILKEVACSESPNVNAAKGGPAFPPKSKVVRSIGIRSRR